MKTFDSDTWKELDKAEMVLARPEAEWREAKSMKRLTSDNTFEMNMHQLALNQVYVGKDGWTQYVEGPDRECSVCDLARVVPETLGVELPMLSDEALSDLLLDWLQYGAEEPEGVVAILYRALCAMAEVRAKLFRYEDTGIEAEEIVAVQAALDAIPFGRFRDIMEAERDGRLVVLPCKVGDEVLVDVRTLPYHYLHPSDGCRDYAKCEVVSIVTTKKETYMKFRALYPSRDRKREYLRYGVSAIGKAVFLAREEAEAALKKREDEQNDAD